MDNNKCKIAVIGMGYVGLPLAVEFGKKYLTVGYDINNNRINELKKFIDKTGEVSTNELSSIYTKDINQDNGLLFSSDLNDLKDFNFFIVAVPTPTDKNRRPDLTPLISASKSVGKILKKGDFVVYESTVYPGVTEEECIPILEKISKLSINDDFYVGYSPERINPGDKTRRIVDIKKVTSGSNNFSAKVIDNLYNSIIKAGTYLAPSIKVAEASKVIENSQRDINIAFVNELSKIFSKLGIDTNSVLDAAKTKWNFLPFQPGLVGGHCIGVDPYYLAQKAQESGYYPEIILAGRRINDSMGSFVASEIVKKMIKSQIHVKDSNALILGFSFKENCPDYRNTKVIDIYNELDDYGLNVKVYDPWINLNDVKSDYKVDFIDKIDYKVKFNVIILAVSHNEFLKIDYKKLKLKKSIIYDIKGFLPHDKSIFRL